LKIAHSTPINHITVEAQVIGEPITTTTTQFRHATITSSTNENTESDITMSLDQAYALAHIAQCRLNKEASRRDRSLRYMVGHLQHYQSLRLHISSVESDFELSKPQLQRTYASSNLSQGQPIEYDDAENDYEDIPYDDEADDCSLSLSRCESHYDAPSQPQQQLPDLESDDSEESDDSDHDDYYDGPVSPEDEECSADAVVPQISDFNLYHDQRRTRASEFDEQIFSLPSAKGVTRPLGRLNAELASR
jgi:hypothetical protein